MRSATRSPPRWRRRTAAARELVANAIANLDIDPERSILLALQAVATSDPPLPEAEAALHRAVQTSRTQLTLHGHTDHVESVAFSPDGTRLATAGNDATGKVWDALTGRELLSLTLPSGWGAKLALSPDGARLAVASTDTSVNVYLLYLLHLDDLVKLAQARLTRSWTAAECQQFLHLELCPEWSPVAVPAGALSFWLCPYCHSRFASHATVEGYPPRRVESG